MPIGTPEDCQYELFNIALGSFSISSELGRAVSLFVFGVSLEPAKSWKTIFLW
jgi:hypothetical protein